MLLSRRHLRSYAWVALLAIFGLAFAPTISHALARAQGQNSLLTQICTPQGMKTISLADLAADVSDLTADAAPASQDGSGGVMNPLEHCPLCGLAASSPGLPVAEVVLVLPLAQATAVPRLFLRAPRPLFVWSAAQPRAPPAGA